MVLDSLIGIIPFIYDRIKGILGRKPDLKIEIKKVNVVVGPNFENSVRKNHFSEFNIDIEFRNRAELRTSIIDFKVHFSNAEPKIKSFHFETFKIPEVDTITKSFSFSFYFDFTEKNNPVILEFTTLHETVLKKEVNIPKSSIGANLFLR